MARFGRVIKWLDSGVVVSHGPRPTALNLEWDREVLRDCVGIFDNGFFVYFDADGKYFVPVQEENLKTALPILIVCCGEYYLAWNHDLVV